jgi:hypothetical protein
MEARTSHVVETCAYSEAMTDRIVLDREEIADLIRGARLLELRIDTPPDVRESRLATATTAMDALCGLSQREGTNAVWDVLEMLDRRELLAFSTLMASELSETEFSAQD